MGCIDKKISELSQLTTPAVNDLLAIVDVSIAGFETRYITVADLVTGGIVAPADAQYVTLALDADLTNERVLTGTANQVIVTDGGAGGPVTLSTPQDIAAVSSPTFAGLTINGNITVTGTVDGIDIAGFAGASFVTIALSGFIANERVLTGTANQVIVTDGGAGGNVTLSTPQDIAAGSTPTFGGLTINGNITVTGTVDGVDVAGANSASYVVMGASADLANERILTGTANQITITDGGAGLPVTISLPSDINLTGASSIGTTAGALTLDPVTQVLIPNNLFIDGSADEIQLRVQAVGGQTANIWTIEDSAGNVLAGADERGVLFSDAGIDVDSVYIGSDAGNTAHTNATQNVGIGKNVLRAATTADFNMGIGHEALYSLTQGNGNVAIGTYALRTLTTASSNMAIGFDSMRFLATGYQNVAIGGASLRSAAGREPFESVAIGYNAGYYGDGGANVYIGHSSGYNNVLSQNTFIGYQTGYTGSNLRDSVLMGYRCGYSLTSGSYNVAFGCESLYYNQTGSYNVVIGYEAGEGAVNNSYTGDVFIGYRAGWACTTGAFNVILGYQAGDALTASNYNVLMGYQAGTTITAGAHGNICVGYQAGDVLTVGTYNIIIGYGSDPTANNASYQLNIGDLIYGDLTANKRGGVNVTPPGLAATWHIDQSSNTGAVPVLLLDQADIDIVMIKYVGTAEAASADRTLVAASDFGTPGALVGWVQVEVQDDGNRIADGDYYQPLYATPT